ncbi:MAG TPA: hypothetical protein VLA28_09910, partial [Afifellaceae bacterium]|nr:hypothetical protein [Afifellaceae bacterium]
MARAAKSNATAEKAKRTTAKPGKKKQAVVVIHGMGEQRPMETLRSFVESVWTKDLSLTGDIENKKRVSDETGLKENKVWIVPDARAGSHELRRITTTGDKTGRRTDFFEFYWADVMQGTTLQHLLAWLKGLLFRSPTTVPRNVFSAWIVLWALTIIAALLAVVAAWPNIDVAKWLYDLVVQPLVDNRRVVLGGCIALTLIVGLGRLRHTESFGRVAFRVFAVLLFLSLLGLILSWEAQNPHPRLFAIGLSALVMIIVHNFIVPTFGDVARYVRAAANTVEKRDLVRNRGLGLLNRLHDCDDYDRIILVGHSLGSILAYDLLQLLWADRAPSRTNEPSAAALDAIAEIDRYVAGRSKPMSHQEVLAYRRAQLAVYSQLRLAKKPWLVSDFVTIGSPLTHAEFLMAKDKSELQAFIQDRLLSKSPPEPDEDRTTITYAVGRAKPKYVHHAAVFAATRWTNIFDPNRFILFGDMISGSLTENFGRGIEEFEVKIERPFLFGLK